MEYPFKDLMPLDEVEARDGYYRDWSHIDADTFHQISELAQFIREKGRGADTREAMAQALERVYHDAAQSGNANMEVSMARKNFKDLASRLDASDDKLLPTVSEIIDARGGKATLGQRLDDTTAQLAQKVGGGKKAEPEDLSATTLGLVTGTGGPINLLSVPQDNSVSAVKTNFLRIVGTGKNKYNPENVTKGQWLTENGGLEQSYLGNFDTTDFFSVNPNDKIYVSASSSPHALNRKLSFYNNGTHVSSSEHFLQGVTVPVGVNMARISFSIDAVNFQIEVGSGVTSYEPHKEFIDLDYNKFRINTDEFILDESITTEKIADKNVTIEKVDFVLERSKTYNQLNLSPDKITPSVLLNEDDSTSTNTAFYLTDLIEVSKGDKVLVSNAVEQGPTQIRAYRLLDSSKNTIKTVSQTSGIGKVLNLFPNDTRHATELEIEEECSFIQLNLRTERQATTMVEIKKTNEIITKKEYIEYKPIKTFRKDFDLADEKVVYPLSGATLVFNGDSITAEYIPYAGEQSIGYVRFVTDYYNATLSNFAIGGSTLAVDSNDPTARNPLVSRYEEMTNGDVIIIAIGTNDWNYTHTPFGTFADRTDYTFYGALHNLCLGLIQKYSGKPILFLTPIKRMQDGYQKFDEPNGNGKTLLDYANAIKEVCGYYSIPVLDMYAESGLNPHISHEKELYLPDGTHPNTAGHRIMARRLIGYLKQLV